MAPCPGCTYLNASSAPSCAICGTLLGDWVDESAASSSHGYEQPPIGGRSSAEVALIQQPEDVRIVTFNASLLLYHVLNGSGRAAPLSSREAARRPAAALCSPLSHVSQLAKDGGDDYTCGYRNLQQLVSALQQHPTYRDALFKPPEARYGGAGSASQSAAFAAPLPLGTLPDVTSLQLWIEAAWASGFDPDGAAQLGGRLAGVAGKWVGSTDIAALLRYFGIPARVIQFHAFDSPHLPLVTQSPLELATVRSELDAAEAELKRDAGLTGDQLLKPWRYGPDGQLKPKFRGRAPGAAAGGSSDAKHSGAAFASSSSLSFSRASAPGPGLQQRAPLALGAVDLDGEDDDDFQSVSEEANGDKGDDSDFEPTGQPFGAAGKGRGGTGKAGKAPQLSAADKAAKAQAKARAEAAKRLYLRRRWAPFLKFLSSYFRAPVAPAPASSTSGSREGGHLLVNAADCHAAYGRGSGGSSGGGTLAPFPLYFQHQGHSRTLVGFEARMAVPPASALSSQARATGGATTLAAFIARHGLDGNAPRSASGAGSTAAGASSAGPGHTGKRPRDDTGLARAAGSCNISISDDDSDVLLLSDDEDDGNSLQRNGRMRRESQGPAVSGGISGKDIKTSRVQQSCSNDYSIIELDDDDDDVDIKSCGMRESAAKTAKMSTVASNAASAAGSLSADSAVDRDGTSSSHRSSSPASDDVVDVDISLLIFDPAVTAATMARSLASGSGWEKHVKRGLGTLRQSAYDVICIPRTGQLMSPSEREASKAAGWGFEYHYL